MPTNIESNRRPNCNTNGKRNFYYAFNCNELPTVMKVGTFCFVQCCLLSLVSCSHVSFPVVVNTWPWPNATNAGYEVLSKGGTAIEAIEAGCQICEVQQCDFTVGYGGSPDESGETTLDAMIMDGDTMNIGAVANLRQIKNAIAVARTVMEYTKHTLISGNQATDFAVSMGFELANLSTPVSTKMNTDWKANNCQPNYRQNVFPNATASCGPYKPYKRSHHTFVNHDADRSPFQLSQSNHDTIAMIAIDAAGHIAAGTSTNGARNKIPGRVGDSPIPGSGSYADSDVGGCGATGDGDIMMRFLPCYQAVESMRNGVDPSTAALDAMKRIALKYPTFQGSIVVINKYGQHAAASYGWTFSYTIRAADQQQAQIITVPPFTLETKKR